MVEFMEKNDKRAENAKVGDTAESKTHFHRKIAVNKGKPWGFVKNAREKGGVNTPSLGKKMKKKKKPKNWSRRGYHFPSTATRIAFSKSHRTMENKGTASINLENPGAKRPKQYWQKSLADHSKTERWEKGKKGGLRGVRSNQKDGNR